MQRYTAWRSLLVLVAGGSFSAIGGAENWPHWRGPRQDGVAAGAGYVTSWGEEENILWKVPVPGWGTSTPAIWGDQIFLTAAENEQNLLLCLNRGDGQTRWKTPLGKSAENRNPKASGSNPSPVTDGSHVYAYFRSGDLACLDLGGAVVWSTNLQEHHGADALNWDLGTSPVRVENLLVVAVMHQAASYLLALDAQSGQQVWKHARETGAPGESQDSYTTPLVVEQDGESTIVVLGADFVTAHSPKTGDELWRSQSLNPQRRSNFRSIASPIAVGDKVIAPYSRGETLTAIRLGGQGEAQQAWSSYDVAPDVPTPTVFEGQLCLCRDRGVVVCVDSETGQQLWSQTLPRNRYNYSSSPIIADGKLYATREDGTTFVLDLRDEPKLVATNVLRENTYATPVFLDGKIYLRTSDYLFCIGQTGA